MLGMGWTEIGFVLVIALVVLGPEKLPQAARYLGKAIRMLRKATADIRRAIEIESVRDELKTQLSSATSNLTDPYKSIQNEEKKWKTNLEQALSNAPPGTVGAAAAEEDDAIWALTENVVVAPVVVANGLAEQASVPMVAVPVHLLGDVRTTPVWGGISGIKQWLEQERVYGPGRPHSAEVTAFAMPRAVFRRTPGTQVSRTGVAVQSQNELATAVTIAPQALRTTAPQEACQKEAS